MSPGPNNGHRNAQFSCKCSLSDSPILSKANGAHSPRQFWYHNDRSDVLISPGPKHGHRNARFSGKCSLSNSPNMSEFNGAHSPRQIWYHNDRSDVLISPGPLESSQIQRFCCKLSMSVHNSPQLATQWTSTPVGAHL